jgi:hypothetical protein
MMLTVSEAASTIDLIDVGAVRRALGIDDQGEEQVLQGHITRASDAIARYCNRTFALQTYVETFRLGEHRDALILSRYPVVEITSVVENDVTLAAEAAEVHSDRGILIRLVNDHPAWWSIGKIVVTYTAGFNVPNETPEALRQAALRLVQSYYLGADRDAMIRSESVENLSSTSFFGEQFPPEVRGVLASFRNMRVR